MMFPTFTSSILAVKTLILDKLKEGADKDMVMDIETNEVIEEPVQESVTFETRQKSDYEKFVQGKTVAIIGGGKTIDQEAADQADIVVRINNHWLTQKGRCDVVYSAMAENPRGIVNAPDLKFFFADRRGRAYSNLLMAGLEQKGITTDTYQTVQREGAHPNEKWLQLLLRTFQCKPFTGVLAMAHVATLGAKSVFLTGMDFYDNDGVPKSRHSHDVLSNIKIVQTFGRAGKFFSIYGDWKLREIIRDYETGTLKVRESDAT